MTNQFSNPVPTAFAVPFPTALPIPTANGIPLPTTANGHNRPGLPPKGRSHYALPPAHIQSKTDINEDQIRQLKDQGFSTGLAKALSSTKATFPLRIWVVDNSGSMQMVDGNRIVETKSSHKVKIVRSTRWAEIQECVKYHVQMAALLRAPTSFRLLNHPGASVGPQQFGIVESDDDEYTISRDVQLATQIMSAARPIGVTPLTEHIIEIEESVREMAPELLAEGKRVSIILATDGLPTDAQGHGGEFENARFVSALRALEGLPVWVVVRLCTDEERVVNFYNNLDGQLELSVEVLDDFVGEAQEVYEHNRWLNYALPLHRCRELGFHGRIFGVIDERELTRGELRDFCAFLFGVHNFDGISDPAVDWDGFRDTVHRLLKHEKEQWNPITKKVGPWIDLKALDKIYGERGCICM